MKTALYLLPILTFFCFAKCEKNRLGIDGLPPATQSGKNTLGFVVNGQAWKPSGSNGTANLSIDVDNGINNGIFNISAYNIKTTSDREHFGIGIKDSLNFITVPKTYQLGNNTLYGLFFSNKNCTFDYFDNAINRSGSLTITKLDKINRIISGTFVATLSKNGCEAIQIREGRFDMKY